MRQCILVLSFLFVTPFAWAVSFPSSQMPKLSEDKVLAVEALSIHNLLGENKNPSIPKAWKLVSVSTREKSNFSNLWFQDSGGAVYLLQGFTSQNKLFIQEHVYKIPAK